jgi:hypothetical protein
LLELSETFFVFFVKVERFILATVTDGGSVIEQKGEKAAAAGLVLFSLLSLNIINVISPLLKYVQVLARLTAAPGVVL